MTLNSVAIDFVAGSHGHFLETTLNKFFGLVSNDIDTFTSLGTSHNTSPNYNKHKVFCANHWSELFHTHLDGFQKIISIRFSPADLLLLSSVSLLRAGDYNIHNDELEIDTVGKLNNIHYQDTLSLIYNAYPFLDQSQSSIPRYVLREFYKFGFKDTDVNGYWIKQQQMQYPTGCEVCYFDFSSFYNIDAFVSNIKRVEELTNMSFDFSAEFYQQHNKFLSFIPYITHKEQCDRIIDCVCQQVDVTIPKLTLFQESYINGQLENIYQKEMPFHQDRYFTSTKDVLYYIENNAPTL